MNVDIKWATETRDDKSSQFADTSLMNIFDPEKIGARIAQAREEAGLTQVDLAVLIGVSTRSVQGYEGGFVKPYPHLDKIAATLNKPGEWFLHGDPEPPAPDPRMEALREAFADEVARVHHLADDLEAAIALLRPDP